MNVLRFNVTLPWDVGNKLKQSKNKSALIAESLREKFQKEEKEKELALLEVAYAASTREEKELLEDWDITVGDGLD